MYCRYWQPVINEKYYPVLFTLFFISLVHSTDANLSCRQCEKIKTPRRERCGHKSRFLNVVNNINVTATFFFLYIKVSRKVGRLHF
jgi:hypothetical protein